MGIECFFRATELTTTFQPHPEENTSTLIAFYTDDEAIIGDQAVLEKHIGENATFNYKSQLIMGAASI